MPGTPSRIEWKTSPSSLPCANRPVSAGARSLPYTELRRRMRSIPKDAEVVAYCRGPYCVYADDVARDLSRRGYCARRLQDGFPEWKDAGLPVAAGEGG